jgi:hypothetical protein
MEERRFESADGVILPQPHGGSKNTLCVTDGPRAALDRRGALWYTGATYAFAVKGTPCESGTVPPL